MTETHPYTIGLIGGIACGKSTALAFFNSHGIETFSADAIAREITAKGTPLYHAIIEKTGYSILTHEQELDRAQLRQRLLHDSGFKTWLEILLHPEIKQRLIQNAKHSKSPYCVLEIPLLQDKKAYPLNQILSIECHPDIQKQRLASRGLSFEEIEGLLEIQTPKILRSQIADDVLENFGSKAEFLQKLEKKHQEYLRAAEAQRTS